MAGSDVVAVFNTSDDIVEILRIALEQAGFIVVSGHVDDVRRGVLSLAEFVREHDPRVVLYDVAPPYDRSWHFLEHVRAMPDMQGRAFVITTTNLHHTRALAGPTQEIFEIIGKPYDIGEVVEAVRQASRSRPVR